MRVTSPGKCRVELTNIFGDSMNTLTLLQKFVLENRTIEQVAAGGDVSQTSTWEAAAIKLVDPEANDDPDIAFLAVDYLIRASKLAQP
jgi:hypothetical protein